MKCPKIGEKKTSNTYTKKRRENLTTAAQELPKESMTSGPQPMLLVL
jgi:hypothetical protein